MSSLLTVDEDLDLRDGEHDVQGRPPRYAAMQRIGFNVRTKHFELHTTRVSSESVILEVFILFSTSRFLILTFLPILLLMHLLCTSGTSGAQKQCSSV